MDFNILVVDDQASIRNSLARLLRGNGYSVRAADCARAALGEVRKEQPDLVLLDIYLPDTSGLEVLTRLKQMNDRIVVVAMTAYENAKDAVLAMKRGAYDYLSKPFSTDAIRLLVKKALDDRHAGEEQRLQATEPRHGSACDRMIGESPAMKKVVSIIHRLPPNSDSNVLAEGETGTGKELVARAIHEASCRAADNFVAVSCAAIPRDLMESELFGYEAGAFTGARPEGKPGAFELAGGGTIFLDEIGELKPEMQAKLLRVLEAREFRRIGGVKSILLRARVIAATNRDLKQEVEQGQFRADLYYRLNVVAMTLPPLREHRDDIIALAESFMREFGARFGKQFTFISRRAQRLLEEYDWPGNVRELRNFVERIVLLESGTEIRPEHLPAEILQATSSPARLPASGDDLCGKRLDCIERECIVRTLKRTGGNVVKAARLLGVRRGALRYRMEKHDIAKEALVPSA